MITAQKINSYIEFTRTENGLSKQVRYDFRDKSFYRVLPNELRKVKSAQEFFRGVRANSVIQGFENPHYGKFLSKINDGESRCSNVATLLDRIEEYAHLEQYIVLGIDFSIYNAFKKPLSNLPKEIIKFFQEIRTQINGRNFETIYSQSPEVVLNIITHVRKKYYLDLEVYRWAYNMIMDTYNMRKFVQLIGDNNKEFFYGTIYDYRTSQYIPQSVGLGFGCEYKALIDYLVRADRAEALAFSFALGQYHDYRDMLRKMNRNEQDVQDLEAEIGEIIYVDREGNSIEKYPKYLQMRHDIVARNFRTWKTAYNEEIFAENVNQDLAYEWGKYEILLPKSTQCLKDEGVNNDHCVATYIDKVINGETQIVFLRLREKSDISLVTVEIRDNRIVQAKGYKNRQPNVEEKSWLGTFAKSKGITY